MTLTKPTALKQWQIVPKSYSANYNITGNDSGFAAHNGAATGAITFFLPAAQPGRNYRFFVASNNSLTVTPKSTDFIRGKGAGASYAASTIGFYMCLTCVVQGAWEIEFNIGPFT